MATKKLQILTELGPSEEKIQSAVDEFFATSPVIHSLIDKVCPPFEVTGSTVICNPVAGYPLEVVSHIQPIQAGSGYSKIRLTRCGKNLLNPAGFTYDRELVSNGGGVAVCVGWYVTDWIPVKPFTTYTLSGTSSVYRAEADINKKGCSGVLTSRATFTTGADGYYVRFNSKIDGYENPQLELGATATAYEPFQGGTFTLDLGQTVYGGILNWRTGLLTDQDGNTHQLTAQQITALSGTNNLYSSTGDTTIVGREDPNYVLDTLLSRVESLEALAVNNT